MNIYIYIFRFYNRLFLTKCKKTLQIHQIGNIYMNMN